MTPPHHREPILDHPDSGNKPERNMRKPGYGAERPEQAHSTPQLDNDNMPFLGGEHAEVFGKDEVTHHIEAEPVKQVVGIDRYCRLGCRAYAGLQLVDVV